MAIAKICSVSGNTFAVLNYAISQTKAKLSPDKKAVIVQMNNVFGDDVRDIANQMAMFQVERPSCKNNTLHISLSFEPGEKLVDKQAETAVNELLKEIGVNKDVHMFLVIQHLNTLNQHYHIVISRVGMDRSLISDSFLKLRLNVACDKMEIEQGLRKTENRQFRYDPSTKKGYKFVPNHKQKSIKTVIAKFSKTNLPDKIRELNGCLTEVLATAKTIGEFEEKLSHKTIKPIFLSNVKGVCGVKFEISNFTIKGSDLGYKWSEINRILNANSISNKQGDIKFDMQAFLKRLESKGDLDEIEPTTKFKLRL